MRPSFVSVVGAALLSASVLLPGLAAAAPLVPGATLPKLQLTDQHDRPVTVDASTRLLIFTADKAGSELTQGVLKAQGPTVLNRIHAVYVADISGMPSLITKMFAMPKLRELPFSVGIVRDAALTAFVPRQPGQATVLVLEAGQVRQIHTVGDENALRQALGL